MSRPTSRFCRACGREFIPAQGWHRLCWECWGAENLAAPVATGQRVWLDLEVARAARVLAHPDLHAGRRQAEATRVCAALGAAIDQTERQGNARAS